MAALPKEMPVRKKTVFQVSGITCLDCAQKFEQKLNSLPGIVKATLNTMSGKLTIETIGDTFDIEIIRRLGHSEDYTIDQIVNPAKNLPDKTANTSVYLKRSIASVIFLAAGYEAEQLDIQSFFAAIESPYLIFYALAVIFGGWGNFKKAFYSLKSFHFNMSVLMSTAVAGAVCIGEYQEAASVAFLYSVSEMLESWTMDKTRRSISQLMNIAPNTALVRKVSSCENSNNKICDEVLEKELPVEDIAVGDIIIVRPGQKIALDGLVTAGHSAINQAPITGESIPVEKKPGDEVFGGTLNTYGAIEIKVTRLVQDTTIAKIINMVEESQANRAPSQTFIEKFAAIYTPVVMALAAAIILLPPLFLGYDWQISLYRGLALLVVACPCALIISTPVAIVSAISSAARKGVLIKGGMYLEQMGSISAMALDKTGTLTKGTPVVTDVIAVNFETEDSLLSLAASLETRSEHPISQAITNAAKNRNLTVNPPESLTAVLGKGVKGVVNGQTVYIGSLRLFEEIGVCLEQNINAALEDFKKQGKTVMLIGTNKDLFGIIAVSDELRTGLESIVSSLKNAGISHLSMLTGDNAATANAVASKAGLDDFKAELLPEDKVLAVKQLLAEYKKVAMIGDGVNDAPALAAATVGVAMGGAGNDTALETADIVLMSDSLDKLPYVIGLSKRTLNIIRQNIVFSISVKLLAVLAVFPGWLTLWLAILADTGAAIIVTLNSLRLFRD